MSLLRTMLWWVPRPTQPRLIMGLAIFGLAAVFWTLVTRAIVGGFRLAYRRRVKPLTQVAAVLTGSAVVVVLEAAWWRAGVRLVTGRAAVGSFAYTTFNNLDTTLVLFGAVLVVLLAIERSQVAAAAEVRASRLAGSLAEVRLHVLGFQLQPHFLFNTLHVLSELVHRGDDSARRLASRLRDLFVSATDAGAPAEITLAEEVSLVRSYLAIQEMRFEARLTVEVSVPPDLAGARVPRFLLQPLVENAIRHGTEPRMGRGAIRVSAGREGDMLRVSVMDNGAGPVVTEAGREGFGLRNTRQRLLQLYGDRFELSLTRAARGGAEAAVRLPYRSAPAPEGSGVSDGDGTPASPMRVRLPASPATRGVLLLGGVVGAAVVWVIQEAELARISGSPFDLARSMGRNALAAAPWVFALPCVATVTARWPVGGARRLAIAAHAAAAIVLAGAMVLTRRLTGAAGSAGPWYGPSSAYVVVITVAGYALVAAAAHLLLAERARGREAARMTQVDADLARARLDLLRWRLQPELLVSVLEDVGRLALSDPDRADQVVVALGDFLRGLLAGVNSDVSVLRDECVRAEAYLALERARGRLGPATRLECPDELREVACAPLAVVSALWPVVRETEAARSGARVNAVLTVVSDPGGVGIRVTPVPEAGNSPIQRPADHMVRLEVA